MITNKSDRVEGWDERTGLHTILQSFHPSIPAYLPLVLCGCRKSLRATNGRSAKLTQNIRLAVPHRGQHAQAPTFPAESIRHRDHHRIDSQPGAADHLIL